jgi:hypothetical protein
MILTQDITKTGSQWGVSLTSSNPEPEDHIACASREDAERLIDHCKGLQNCANACEGRLEEILTVLGVEEMDPETSEEGFQALLGTVREAMKSESDLVATLRERINALGAVLQNQDKEIAMLKARLEAVSKERDELVDARSKTFAGLWFHQEINQPKLPQPAQAPSGAPPEAP